MKFILLLSLSPLLGFSQIFLNDDFSDGDFHQNLPWSGDGSVFKINSQNALQLNDSIAGESFLSTASKIANNASWEFELNLAFNPSSSNFARVYLMANSKDLTTALDGYFIRIGGSSNDKVSLIKQQGLTKHLICESQTDFVDANSLSIRIKVIRDSLYKWTLMADTGLVLNPLQNLASGVDSSFRASRYFGLVCNYTKTRSKLFTFDDFNLKGDSLIDRHSPRIDTIVQVYKNKLEVILNERVRKTEAENLSNYEIFNSVNTITNVQWDSIQENRVVLTFSDELYPLGLILLKVKGLKDLAGNEMNQTFTLQLNHQIPELKQLAIEGDTRIKLDFSGKIQEVSLHNILINNNIYIDSIRNYDTINRDKFMIYLNKKLGDSLNYQLRINGLKDDLGYLVYDSLCFSNHMARRGDVVFNEIMADPSPVVGIYPQALPEIEYLELFNASDFYINLANWRLSIGGRNFLLPFTILRPKAYLLLVMESGARLFSDSIRAMELGFSSTILKNSGAILSLSSSKNLEISHVEYSQEYYQNPLKENGGWSLERKDPFVNCEGSSNWQASNNYIGGTPGYGNSRLQTLIDTVSPILNYADLVGDSVLILYFSKSLIDDIGWDKESILIQPNLKLAELRFSANSLVLKFEERLVPDVLYSLRFESNLYDCLGNELIFDSVVFALPSMPEPGDVFINEVLFDPKVGGSEFVEIFNGSSKVFDLNKMYIGNWDPLVNSVDQAVLLSEKGFLLSPKSHLVLAKNPDDIMEKYYVQYPQKLIENRKLFSLDDREGDLALLSSQWQVIDHLRYHADWHSPLLNSVEGVSLERLSIKVKTNASYNWQSASTSCGYASPTYRNCQSVYANSNLKISLQPRVFSPNLDGYNDLLSISYNFDLTGGVVFVAIYNSVGNRVKVLLNNESVAPTGICYWDGLDKDGNALPAGVYIVLLEYFHEEQGKSTFKQACILSR